MYNKTADTRRRGAVGRNNILMLCCLACHIIATNTLLIIKEIRKSYMHKIFNHAFLVYDEYD